MYTRITDGVMRGMAVMAIEESGEAVLVNIVGSLDSDSLAGLAEVLDIPQLGLAAGFGSSRDRDTEDDGDNR